jgi:hypothetical protein
MTRCGNFAASPEGQELAVLCLELDYKLADRVQDLTRTQINFLLTAVKLVGNDDKRLEIGDSGFKIGDDIF